MKKTILTITILLLFLCSHAWATDYYVTQSGAGTTDGKSLGNAWSVASFNSSANWSATANADKIDPGDTVYFSGTITSSFLMRGSGTSGNPITIDGYEAGSCNPVVDEHCNNGALISLSTGHIGWNKQSYITFQDFEVTNTSASNSTPILYIASYFDTTYSTTNNILKRNYVHTVGKRGVYFGWSENCTFGGANGDGNYIRNCGRLDKDDQMLTLFDSDDVIVSYNRMGQDLTYDGAWKSQNIMTLHNCDDVLIEYNYIHNPQGGGCISLKENGTGNRDVIIRYNKLKNGAYTPITENNFGVASSWYNQRSYIYCNYISELDIGLALMKECQYIYFFSNIVEESTIRGVTVQRATATPLFSVNHGYIFNNTFYGNGYDNAIDQNNYSLFITEVESGGDLTFTNNIFLKEGEGAPYYEVGYITSTSEVDFDYNLYYYDAGNPVQWKWGGLSSSYVKTMAEIQALGHEAHVVTTDPGLTNPTNDDFTVRTSNSPVVGAGENLSGGTNITIQGTVHHIDYATRLHPTLTDWSTTPPTVVGVSDGIGAWTIGAYKWVGDVDQAPTASIDTPTITTVDVNATGTLSGSYTDPEGDTCTYAWVIPTNTFKVWDAGTTYALNDLVEDDGVAGAYYKSKQAANTNHNPPDATWWDDAETQATPGNYTCDLAGTYNIGLTVNDGTSDSQPVSLALQVNTGGVGVTTQIWSKNTTGTYQQSIAGYDEGDVSFFSIAWPTSNASTQTYWRVGEHSGNLYNQRAAISYTLDHANISGETITDAVVGFYLETNPDTTSGNVEIWSCSDAFVEAQTTWNIYSTGNSWTGTHGKNTFLAETNFTTSSTESQFYTFSGAALTSYVATQALAGATCYFIIVVDTDDTGQIIFTSDDGTDGNRPYLQISYGGSSATTPEIVNITTTTLDGSYRDGDSIGPFQVTFNEPVVVTGTPTLKLELGANDATVNYSSGTGTATLTFAAFSVASASNHATADLDGIELDRTAGGTIVSSDDATAVAVTGTLLDSMLTGAATIGSLAYNKAIIIDTAQPTITAVNNTDSNATADTGASPLTAVDTLVKFAIDVNTSDLIVYSDPGFPRIEMSTHPDDTIYANYIGEGDATDILIMGFYTTIGMRTAALNFTGDLDLGPGGSITDPAGNVIEVSMGVLDLTIGAIIELTVPFPSTAPKEFTDAADYTAWLAGTGYTVINDHFVWTEDAATDGFDASGEDGTSGNEITYNGQGFSVEGNQTYGDYSIITRMVN